MGHERAHAELLSQGQGLLIVGFGLHDIRGIGVGMGNAKLVQRTASVPRAFCCWARSSAWRASPGLLTASRQTTDLAEPGDPSGDLRPRTRAETTPIASSNSARPSARRPCSAAA